MTIMFQVDDLSQASPATISRCGMVLLEAAQLGHNVFIKSYTNELRKLFDEKICAKVEEYFTYIADICVEYTKQNCKFPCPGTGAYVINHMIRIMDCYIDQYKSKNIDGEDEITIPGDIQDKLINALIYSAIWGIGGAIDENTRASFDKMFQELLLGEDIIKNYELDLPENQ